MDMGEIASRVGALAVHVDARRVVDAQHPVVAEVGLLDAAVLDRDLAMEDGR